MISGSNLTVNSPGTLATKLKTKRTVAATAKSEVKGRARTPRLSRAKSAGGNLVCRYCGSDDLAPSFKKRRDARCRACFKKQAEREAMRPAAMIDSARQRLNKFLNGLKVSRQHDRLLDEPLMSAKDIESWGTDIRAVQKGDIPSFARTDFWERAKTEWCGAKLMRKSAPQMRLSVVILSIFTGLLVAVSVVQLFVRCR
jgi:hypothetical protein